MDPNGRDLWVAPECWHKQLGPLAAHLGRTLLTEGTSLMDSERASILYFRNPKSLNARAIAQELSSQEAPWGVLTLPPDSEQIVERIREQPKRLNSALVASSDDCSVTVIQGDEVNKYRLDEIDLGRLVTQQRWSICALHGHGENGHFRVGTQVFCSAAVGESSAKTSSLICQPPYACRRSPSAPAIWFGAIQADVLATITCSGWTVGGELCQDNLSSVRAIQCSQVLAWLTGWGPVRISHDDFHGFVAMLVGGVSPGVCASLMNDVHRRRWGYAPFILWGDPRPVRAPSGLGSPPLVTELAGRNRPVFAASNAKGVLVGERFLLSFEHSFEDHRKDVAEQVEEIQNRLTHALAIDRRIGLYLAGIRLCERAAGPYASKLGLLHNIVEEQYLQACSRLEKARREGVISHDSLALAERLVTVVAELDVTLAEAIAFEVNDIDLWEIFAPFVPINQATAPSQTECCPQNANHPLLVFSTGEPVRSRYIECATCGPVSMHQTGAVSFSVEAPLTLTPGKNVTLLVRTLQAPSAAIRVITLSEKISNRSIVVSVDSCSSLESFRIELPQDLVAEAHHLTVFTVAAGKISSKSFRPVTGNLARNCPSPIPIA